MNFVNAQIVWIQEVMRWDNKNTRMDLPFKKVHMRKVSVSEFEKELFDID